jgi:hypothetical protein
MIPVQEIVIRTIEGKRFQAYIINPSSDAFEWHLFFSDPKTIYYGFHPATKRSKKANTAFEEVIQFIDNYLKKQGNDKIEYLDNPCNCELVSSGSQKKIIGRQSYVFPVKVNGK